MSETRVPPVPLGIVYGARVTEIPNAARRRHTIFLAVCALIVSATVWVAQPVMLPFVLASVLAYVLTPLVAWVERLGTRLRGGDSRPSRPLAIVLVYVVVLGVLGTAARLGAPRLVQELGNFRHELPEASHTIRHRYVPVVQEWLRSYGLGGAPPPDAPLSTMPEHEGDHDHEDPPALVARQRPDGSFSIEISEPIAVMPTKNGGFTIDEARELKPEPFDLDKMVADAAGKSILYAQHNAFEIVKIGRNVVAGVSRVFFVFALTFMLAAYMMLTRERIVAFFVSLVRPTGRPSFHELLARIDRGLAGVVRGQLIICLINGVLSAIGFGLVGLKYWPVLALVATIFSLVPIFGSIASAIPAVAFGLTQSIGTAMFVLAWIVGIHQIEANLLNPKIMGDQAKIHPVLVVFSLLVGEHFFGVVGALLAVPVMSITQSVFIHVRQRIQASDPEMANEPVGSLPPLK